MSTDTTRNLAEAILQFGGLASSRHFVSWSGQGERTFFSPSESALVQTRQHLSTNEGMTAGGKDTDTA